MGCLINPLLEEYGSSHSRHSAELEEKKKVEDRLSEVEERLLKAENLLRQAQLSLNSSEKGTKE